MIFIAARRRWSNDSIEWWSWTAFLSLWDSTWTASAKASFPFRAFYLSEAYVEMRQCQAAGDAAPRQVHYLGFPLRLNISVTKDGGLLFAMASCRSLSRTSLSHVLDKFTSEGDRLLKMHRTRRICGTEVSLVRERLLLFSRQHDTLVTFLSDSDSFRSHGCWPPSQLPSLESQ